MTASAGRDRISSLTIGTRGSRLALRQVEIVGDALRSAHHGLQLKVREIHTDGDRSSAPLSEIGGTGVFTKAIEDALLRGDVDVAVHSLKDLPADLAPGLTLAAIPKRADPRDALVTATGGDFHSLRVGARVGTGSGRRDVQLRALRPDISTVDIRGNVDTRIQKVLDGRYDAVVLAAAGLERLGLDDPRPIPFSVEDMLPAVGQGALAVEARADDAQVLEILREVDDPDARAAVVAERAFLRRLGAGCRLPVAAYASLDSGELWLRGMIAGNDGQIFRDELRGSAVDGEAIGVRLADLLVGAGAVRSADVR